MRKQKITRLLCLALAMLFLVSTAVVAVSADTNDNLTDKSIEDYGDKLNTISYESYLELHADLFKAPNATVTAGFDTVSNWVFEDDAGNKIELDGTDWKMTTKNGVVYNSIEDAEKAGFKKTDMVYVGQFNGKEALYTPSVGSVTWTFDLGAAGITETGLYSMMLEYCPLYIEGVTKSSAIERELYINGDAPFAEARALTLAKIWSFSQAVKEGEDYAVIPLIGEIKPSKKESVESIIADLPAVFNARASEDGKSVIVDRPLTVTQEISEYIDKYTIRFTETDGDRNELRPTQLQTPEWTNVLLRDSGGFYANNFGFAITPDANGKITVTLDAVNEPMAIANIVLTPYTEVQSYDDYLKSLGALADKEGTGKVKLEAESPVHTSTNVVYPIEDRASAATSPADTTRVMLNTIGTEKWATAGQWIEYMFEVDGSGMYEIISRYKQSYLDGMYTNRSLQIFTEGFTADEYKAKFGNTAGYYNGTPFAEAAALRYDYGNKWQVTGMTSGEVDAQGNKLPNYELYFEAGVTYTLRLEVTLGSMSELVQKVENVLNHLNNDYLNIIQLTGTSPDDYRDYSFSRLLPDTLLDMLMQANELEEISQFLKDSAGVASTYSGTCDKLVVLLRKVVYDEDELAKNLKNLKAYIGNLGTFLTDAKTQPLQLDYMMVQGASAETPVDNANFFVNFLHECKSFIQSFFRDYNSMGAPETTEEIPSIDVWLAYGRDQSQVLRNLSTNNFTPDHNIAVNLKLVSGGTLLPSILAGMGPDVYLGLDDATVINYAIRGALNNIEEKEGFAEMVEEYFTDASMIQLEIADADGDVHTYGLPEQQTFEMMFVRLDVLYNLGIEIPRTWEDIYTAQSILESQNMEIGLTTNYKRFLYQTNGDLYADDGMRINLDSVKGLAAFEKMCNLFTQHSFEYQYDAANRFRTGEMPIILASYTALYNQLKVFATEIDGQWTFVPIPGTVQEDGSINNTADSTITAVVMISDIEDEASAWEFMKWYTGAECQRDYANEMVAIIGDSAKHPTANRVALESLPWTRDEYAEVSKQFENLAAIPNYPGSYFIDRHTNFAFLAAYNEDADPVTEILSYINTINKEITRKREEFKLETLEIGQTLADKRMNQAMNAIENLTEKYGETKYKDAIETAKYGVANRKIAQLDEAAKLFEDILAADWDGSVISVTKVNGKVVEMPSYYKNVGKQTAEEKNGGYRIDSLDEQQLVYFIAVCLADAADALESYK